MAPIPLPTPGASSGWRTTILSAGLMIGVLFGVNIVNAAVPLPSGPGTVDPGPGVPVDPNPAPRDPNQPSGKPQASTGPVAPGPVAPGAGLKIGSGVVIYPPDGWTVLGSDKGVTVLQKGGVVMISAGIAWTGTPLDLAGQYRDVWFKDQQLTANNPESGSVGSGVPGAALSYSGVFEGTQVDGVIVAGATGGAGVIFNIFGAQGSLNGVSDDINTVFGTVQFTGDPG
jgi:hypothetical protein